MNKEKPIHYNIAFNSGRFLTSIVYTTLDKLLSADLLASLQILRQEPRTNPSRLC